MPLPAREALAIYLGRYGVEKNICHVYKQAWTFRLLVFTVMTRLEEGFSLHDGVNATPLVVRGTVQI